MFLNFLISAFRNLIRNKVQSIIQITSLSLGLMVFILISLYTYDSITIDRSNENLERIYRVEDNLQVSVSIATVSIPTGPIILDRLPEVENMTRIVHWSDEYLTRMDENGEPGRQVQMQDFMLVDSGFLEIFPQDFLLGDPATALRNPENIVLTERVSETLFGSENPMGQTVLTGSGRMNTVSGIIKAPLNTHLKFEALIPIHRNKRFTSEVLYSNPRSLMSGTQVYPTYITINKNTRPEILAQKIEDAWHEWCFEVNPDYNRVSLEADISLCPLKQVHFSEVDPGPYMSRANRKSVMSLFQLGVIILLLGIINYVNLSTARATMRNREISIRKIHGSSKFKLIFYFLTESILTTLISFLIALTLAQLFFPRFVNILQADINLYFLEKPQTWIIAAAGTLFIGILAGFYPALRMSAGSATIVQTGSQEEKGKGLLIRRILMILQFSATVALLIGILVMHLQISQLKKQDLGFTTDQVVWTNVGNISPEFRTQLLKRLERYPEIEKAGLSGKVPGRGFTAKGALYNYPGSKLDGITFSYIPAAPKFLEVYGLEFIYMDEVLKQNLLKGIDDNPSFGSATYLVVNEAFVEAAKMEDPMEFLEDGVIISGIVKDFHYQTLEYELRPLSILLYKNPGSGNLLSMRINSANIHKTLRQVEKDIQEITNLNPWGGEIQMKTPVEFAFIEDTFNAQYEPIQRVHDAFVYFFILAIIIACLGLFGLTIFVAQRRTKEIGIRKALGSTERQVFLLLARDFIKWISLSVIIGCPLGWYLMKLWQQQFAFKAHIGIWVYLVTILIAFGIAFLTVAWQSLKAARANPVDALRDE